MRENIMQPYQVVNKTIPGERDSYAGIPIYAWPNLHIKCFERFQSLHLNKKSKILILWSGWWAFDQRLVDNGYTNITSVEFIPEAFRATGTTFICRDLNDDFTDLGTFDCIIALEIIEHLENPFQFIRNISDCLVEGGYTIISTPNVENFYSRAHFLWFNTMDYFGNTDLYETGHISPILHHIFVFFTKNSHLKILERTYSTSAVHQWWILLTIFAILIMIPLFLMGREVSSGAVNIYLLKKEA